MIDLKRICLLESKPVTALLAADDRKVS